MVDWPWLLCKTNSVWTVKQSVFEVKKKQLFRALFCVRILFLKIKLNPNMRMTILTFENLSFMVLIDIDYT